MLSEKAPQHHIKHNHLVVLGFFSAFIGVFLFANGFLLTRSELTNITNTSSLQPSDFQQVILILVDGLYTGLLPLTNESEKMPFFKNLIHQQGFPRNHFLAHFIADPPTTTLQRLKALLTGSMPTFIDAGSNFGGTELQEDNILKQWALAGKNICFVGDQVWTELVSDVFLESFPLPAFNIKDLDTVDTAVKDYVLREVGSGKCDVLIGHMLGIDHCGHTFGRSHPEMDRKLLELDGFLKRLIAHLTPSSLLVVFGDHGMTASGDHGGDSDAEVDAALFVYTPRGFPRVRDASIDDGSPLPSIEQVDLVPTLASLTGVSIPFSNLGVVATTLLNSSHLLSAVNANFRQVVTYAKEYHDRFGTISTPEAMVSRLAHNSTTPCPAASIDECLLAMRSLRASFRTHWTRMDVPRMALGLLFTLHALLAFVAYDNNLPVPGPVWCVAATLAAASLVALTPLGSFLLALLPSYRLAAVWLSSKDLSPSRGTLLTGTLLVVLALTSCSNSFVVQEARVLGFVLQTLLLAASLFALDSEHWPGAAWRSVVCVCLLHAGLRLEVCREESPAGSMCVVVGGSDSVWLTPLSSLPWHQLKRLAPPRLLLAFWGLFSGLLAHQWLLKPAKGRRSVGGLVEFLLKNTTLAVGGGLVVLWTLDGLIAASLGSTAISSILQPRLLATLRVNLARLLMLSCFCLLGVLVHRPLLIAPTPVPRDAAPPRVCNHAIGDAIRVFEPDDVYAVWLFAVLVAVPALTLLALLGDVYVLPCLGLLACLLLAPVHELALPRGRRTENDACSQVASQLEGVGSWPSAIYACLLGQFGFFCFGHQTTFPAIPWSAAFAVFQGDHGTTLLPAGLVLAHTFTAQILLTAALPLLLIVCVLRRTSPTTKSTEPVLFRSQQGPMVLRTTLDRLLRRYCIAHFLLFVGHLLSAFFLRRHLMVWKIFAPRLIFSLFCLGTVCLTVVLVRTLALRCLRQLCVGGRRLAASKD